MTTTVVARCSSCRTEKPRGGFWLTLVRQGVAVVLCWRCWMEEGHGMHDRSQDYRRVPGWRLGAGAGPPQGGSV